MGYSVRILADSVNPVGDRLTTFECRYPRFVHSELLTHKDLSRNSASSRAIPISKMIEQVQTDPAMPVWWGKNQAGMQAREELPEHLKDAAKFHWLKARDKAVGQALEMVELGVHKQIVNRLLEPWMWITVLVTATNYANFFSLRCHPDAQPEIQKLAYMMRDAYFSSKPRECAAGEWHTPLLDPDELLWVDPLDVSVGRCARVSYLTHDGKRDPQADVDLCKRLIEAGHLSPGEHVAMALDTHERVANLTGWRSYRKLIPNENKDTYEWNP